VEQQIVWPYPGIGMISGHRVDASGCHINRLHLNVMLEVLDFC